MIVTTTILTSAYLYKEVKKRKAMNTALKEREVIMEDFRRHFNEKYDRASNIKKLRIKKRIREMLKSKLKYKR